MKIATWNVNSLNVRLPHVQQWLDEYQPDVLVLQETKLVDEKFPVQEILDAGYQAIFSGQKTYNGVAMLSRQVGDDIVTDFPGFDDPQRRILAATVDDVRIVNLYVPNGSEVGSDKYHYKLEWLQHCKDFIAAQLQHYPKVVVLGDFNIAPANIDVYDPEKWGEAVLCSPPEREALQAILDLGVTDIFRQLNPEEQVFSWWDYRQAAFRRNLGLRIDLILTSAALNSECVSVVVDKAPRKWERPSDHAPVMATFG